MRDDGWGGSIEDRARLLVEVIGAVRARLGAAFPVWFRINAVEPHKPDGERFDDQLRVMELAVAAGADAVHVTAYAERFHRSDRFVRAARGRTAERLRRRARRRASTFP